MNIFLKWLLRASLFLIGVTLLIILTLADEFESSRLPKLILFIISSILFLTLFLYLLEVKIIPWRIKKLNQKIIRIFTAIQLSENCTQFKLDSFDFYSVIHISLTFSQYGGSREFVHFHIPQDQIDNRIVKPKFKYKKSNLNGIETYLVFETNGLGVNFAKNRLKKKIK